VTILAIETSCDETAVAILRGRNRQCGPELLASEVASQIAEHEKFGGVVPEVASRNHVAQLPCLLERAMASAKITINEIDAFAATSGPGLASSLLVGNSAAKGLAIGAGKPFLAINHLEGHLLSPFFGREKIEPNIALIVSGGHTILVHVRAELDHEVLGSTIDDAAGECFDKVGKLIGLPYPGGPEVDRFATEGNPKAYSFPRPMLSEANDDFSFAGLKTSVRYFLEKNPDLLKDSQKVRDLCASVQAAIVEVLVTKTTRAAQRLGVSCITASGGVTCNRSLREKLESACRKEGFSLRLAERQFCTDNGAMIAVLAERKLLKLAGRTSLDAEVLPGMSLATA